MDWFRMYGEFATDPKVQMMSEVMQRRLVMLFCLQCCNVLATLHETERDAAVAFQLRISQEDCTATKELFCSKGFIDCSWNVVKWSERQYQSDSSTERSRKHREAKKQARAADATLQQRSSNALDTDTDTDTDTDKTKSKALCDEPHNTTAKPTATTASFDAFWAAFADKRGKEEALKVWKRIKPSADLAEQITAAAERYAAYRAAVLLPQGRTPKMAQGWLSGERWNDELPTLSYTPEQVAFIAAFNENIGEALPTVSVDDWTQLRADRIDAAVAKWGVQKWAQFFAWVRDACVFDFPATIDWLLIPDNFAKVKEGAFERRAAA